MIAPEYSVGFPSPQVANPILGGCDLVDQSQIQDMDDFSKKGGCQIPEKEPLGVFSFTCVFIHVCLA